MDLPPYYAGQLLLAMPGIGDANFDRSVIALCAHDANGALGIDVGCEIEGLGLRELLSTFDIDGSAIPDTPVLRGGPVEPRRGFVLHSLDWGGQDMLQIDGQWGLSGSVDVLKAIAEGRAPGDAGIIFDTPTRRRWAGAFAASGVDSAMLVSEGGRA